MEKHTNGFTTVWLQHIGEGIKVWRIRPLFYLLLGSTSPDNRYIVLFHIFLEKGLERKHLNCTSLFPSSMQVFSENDKYHWFFPSSKEGTWTTYFWCKCLQGKFSGAPDLPSQPEELQHLTHLYFDTPQFKRTQIQNTILCKCNCK